MNDLFIFLKQHIVILTLQSMNNHVIIFTNHCRSNAILSKKSRRITCHILEHKLSLMIKVLFPYNFFFLVYRISQGHLSILWALKGDGLMTGDEHNEPFENFEAMVIFFRKAWTKLNNAYLAYNPFLGSSSDDR